MGHFSSKMSKEMPLRTLNEFLFTKIEEKHIGNIWFQQDGTAEATLDVLRRVFEDCIISRRADVGVAI